jgi:N-acetylglucosamine kinase-like BadF-type ATPase
VTVGTVLGVDVGNSKTHAAVMVDGRIVAAGEGPGVAHGYGDPGAVLRLVDDLTASGRPSATPFEAACFAVAGLDLPEQDAAYSAVIAEAAIAPRLAVLNDVFALLRTATVRGDGVAVVAGAGINAVGVRGERHVRYHSFGEVSGDWGGGADLGRAALGAASRAEDGRGVPTALSAAIASHFGEDSALDVVSAIMLGRLAPARLTELAPLVISTAEAGDAVARSLVDRVADEVVAFVEATRSRLAWTEQDGPLPVLLGGGLLRSGSLPLLDRIRAGIGDGERSTMAVASVPPVIGAVLLAQDLLEADGREADIHRMAEEFERALGARE